MPAKQFVNWQISDPKHMAEEEFRGMRDFIEQKVKSLLQQLKVIAH